MDSVVVLIAAPGSGAITPEIVAMLRDFGGGEARWLKTGDALEFDAPAQLPELKRALGNLPLDCGAVPKHNRRKRLLIADMDSTMIDQECIDELGVVAGVGDRIKDITARAMRGELDFNAALRERVALLKGLDTSVIGSVLKNRITFASGGRTLLATMKAHGAHTALVSGGFTTFTGPVAAALTFDENHANTLLVENGRLTGQVALPILGKEAKVERLKAICAARGLSSDDVLAVGDGANDIPMLLAAGLGVALHAKPNVQAKVSACINHGDLTALLYLQGYRSADFVV